MPKNIPDDIKKMDEKIAKFKKNMKQDPNADKEADVSGIFKGLRLGLEFASGTIIGAAIGYMLDELFDFQFIMLLIFTIFGGFAGMLNAYRYLKSLDENKGE